MAATSAAEIAQLVGQALSSIDADDPKAAVDLLAQLASHLGSDDPRLLHVEGMFAWAEGDIEEAASKLTSAVDAEAQDERAYFDCAELMLSTGLDIDVAEASLRAVLGREALGEDRRDQAKILLAQVCLEQVDADADEALELLDSASEEAKRDVFWTSTKAAALLDQGRADDAIRLLESASSSDEAADDADVQYQLGICYALAGRGEQAVSAMTRVVKLDAAGDEYDPVDEDERDGLRACLEEVLESIPEPLLKRVASAPIEVQTRPQAEQIAGGVDPRAFVAFDGDPVEQALRAVVIMRNVLLDELEDEEQLPEALISGLIDEFRRFFGVEELAAASA